MFTKTTKQPVRVTTAALNQYFKQYPFKDLTGMPGYVPTNSEAELAARYQTYRELLIKFVEEKEENNKAFSELSAVDQKKNAQHPGQGSKEDGQRRLRYIASRLRISYLFPELKAAALALQAILTDQNRYVMAEEDANFSDVRRSLMRCNETFAAGLLHFFLEIKAWLWVVRERPSHEGTISGCSLVLPSEIFRLLTESGNMLIGSELAHTAINIDEY